MDSVPSPQPSLTNVISIPGSNGWHQKGEVPTDSFAQREQGTVQGSDDRSNAAAKGASQYSLTPF
jgi:hypothetical protein